MKLSISKENFANLKRIESINQNNKFFTREKGYSNPSIKSEVKRLQKPVWDKMNELKNSLFDESYFNERFDIIVSRPNKQSTKTVKGPIRRLAWVSLASLSELNKKENEKLKHVHVPQLQVSFQPDRLIAASIWLEGNNCKQGYREKIFSFLKKNGLSKKYKFVVYNKINDKKEFEDYFSNLAQTEYKKFLAGRNFSVGIYLIYKTNEVTKLKFNLYTLILSELQILNENILIPCYNFNQISSEVLDKKNQKIRRRAREKFDIKNSLRKPTKVTIVTKKHQEIQNFLYDLFLKRIKDKTEFVRLEKDFVDIRIENPSKSLMILYEIKTANTALNCIKQGLGQLLFYDLVNKKDGWENIELVIVGLPVMDKKAKDFVKIIKKYLGKESFRYQRFDENSKILLDEKKS